MGEVDDGKYMVGRRVIKFILLMLTLILKTQLEINQSIK